MQICFYLLSFIQPEPLWPDACGLPRRLHHQHGQSASRGKVLGATFKFYKQKSFTSQPLGKPKEQFQNILQYLALETLISTTFRMLEYYNANDEVEQMIRRLFRCRWKIQLDYKYPKPSSLLNYKCLVPKLIQKRGRRKKSRLWRTGWGRPWTSGFCWNHDQAKPRSITLWPRASGLSIKVKRLNHKSKNQKLGPKVLAFKLAIVSTKINIIIATT